MGEEFKPMTLEEIASIGNEIATESMLLSPKEYGGMYPLHILIRDKSEEHVDPPHLHVWDSSHKHATGSGTAEIIITDKPPKKVSDIQYKRGTLNSKDADRFVIWANLEITNVENCKTNWDNVKEKWNDFYRIIYLPKHPERKDITPKFPSIHKINLWGSIG